ncbi:hypothetical protein [Cryobacterium sp. SO1]|uniref:hypothetical protein n=1 Tax=Cryobacterium sp. SO1 TaxID=1897061 RepID=UPI0010E27718|nr:hypothetical protein BJQ95_03466 [Cryobacterium sp. SO1]
MPATVETGADETGAAATGAVKPLRIEFCGEWYSVEPGSAFSIGRESDLTIDDNPYLHRTFLRLYEDFGMWWIANVGNLLSATVSDTTGSVQAWLAPGAKLPIVFQTMHVMFSAGSSTYDFTIHAEDDFYNTSLSASHESGSTTILPVTLTTSQRLLIVALSERILTQSVPGRGAIPSSAEAAARVGWSMTTFNRKLDNVCSKLDKLGVAGLRGGTGHLATNRRARLVEYAVATRLVSVDDVVLLDRAAEESRKGEEYP